MKKEQQKKGGVTDTTKIQEQLLEEVMSGQPACIGPDPHTLTSKICNSCYIRTLRRVIDAAEQMCSP